MASACHTSKQATFGNSKSTAFKPNTADRDGTSFAKAIIVEEKTEMAGINAEYAWIAKTYPGSKTHEQALLSHDGIPFDMIKVTKATGEEIQVYFDISNYYGKW